MERLRRRGGGAVLALAVLWAAAGAHGCAPECRNLPLASPTGEIQAEATLVWSGDVTKLGARRNVAYRDSGELESYAALTRLDGRMVCLEVRQCVAGPDASQTEALRKDGFVALHASLAIGDRDLAIQQQGTNAMLSEVDVPYTPKPDKDSAAKGLEAPEGYGGAERFAVLQGVLCFALPGPPPSGECLELSLSGMGVDQSYCWIVR